MTQGQESKRKGRRRYTDKRTKAGLCAQCGKPKEEDREDKTICKKCTDKRTKYQREYQSKRKGKKVGNNNNRSEQ